MLRRRCASRRPRRSTVRATTSPTTRKEASISSSSRFATSTPASRSTSPPHTLRGCCWRKTCPDVLRGEQRPPPTVAPNRRPTVLNASSLKPPTHKIHRHTLVTPARHRVSPCARPGGGPAGRGGGFRLYGGVLLDHLPGLALQLPQGPAAQRRDALQPDVRRHTVPSGGAGSRPPFLSASPRFRDLSVK